MTTPLLSVVIPVYNGEELLPDCLRSVGGAVAHVPIADRAKLEIILCDNHSTDRTREIAERFDPGCPYRIIQPPEHLPNRTENWNYGLRQGHGEWLMMLHHDDLLGGDWLWRFTEFTSGLKSGHKVSIVAGRQQSFATGSQIPSGWPMVVRDARFPGKWFHNGSLAISSIFPPETAVRSDIFSVLNGLDPGLELLQDWDFWLRASQTGEIAFLAEDVVALRQHQYSDWYLETFAHDLLTIWDRLREEASVPIPVLAISAMRQANVALVFTRGRASEQSIRNRLANWPNYVGLAEKKYVLAFVYRFVRPALVYPPIVLGAIRNMVNGSG